MKTMICVPLFERKPEKILESAQNAIKSGADILELRVDGIRDPNPRMVKKLIEDIGFPVIATNRSKVEGGYFRGSEDERVEILCEAASAAEYVDIELSTERSHIERVADLAENTIVSFHDFSRTPSLDALLRIVRMEKELGDIAKVAVTPADLGDTVVVLQLLAVEDNTIAISMGELGKYTRVVAALFGSPVTFASLNHSTAPGQMGVKETREMIEKLLPEDR